MKPFSGEDPLARGLADLPQVAPLDPGPGRRGPAPRPRRAGGDGAPFAERAALDRLVGGDPAGAPADLGLRVRVGFGAEDRADLRGRVAAGRRLRRAARDEPRAAKGRRADQSPRSTTSSPWYQSAQSAVSPEIVTCETYDESSPFISSVSSSTSAASSTESLGGL